MDQWRQREREGAKGECRGLAPDPPFCFFSAEAAEGEAGGEADPPTSTTPNPPNS